MTIDVSRTVAGRFKDDEKALLFDPSLEIERIIRERVPADTKEVVLTNIGILFEPVLHLPVAQFLLKLAVDFDVILDWNGEVRDGKRLIWSVDGIDQGVDFDEMILQPLENAR